MIAPKGSSNFSNKTVYLILALAAALILVLGCGFVWMIAKTLNLDGSASAGGPNQKINPKITYLKGDDASVLKPDQVIKAFLLELREEQLEDAYQRTSVGFQGSMSQGDFNAFVQKNKALVGHVTYRYSQSGQTADGGKSFKGHVAGGPHGGTDFSLDIGPEEQGWRVRKFTVP